MILSPNSTGEKKMRLSKVTLVRFRPIRCLLACKALFLCSPPFFQSHINSLDFNWKFLLHIINEVKGITSFLKNVASNCDWNPIVLGNGVLIYHCSQEFQKMINRQKIPVMALAQNFNEDFYIHGQETSMITQLQERDQDRKKKKVVNLKIRKLCR